MNLDRAQKNDPKKPWIFHIIHFDRLYSILKDGFLYSDATMTSRETSGTTIGISKIKERRLKQCIPHSTLTVGQCVPFYYCPRSPMLYVIYQKTHEELTYRDGQSPIIHLAFKLSDVATWASNERLQYFITNENAASSHFDAFQDLDAISRLNWDAINATQWVDVKSEKAAEFLVESRVSSTLLRAIGTHNDQVKERVQEILKTFSLTEKITVKTVPQWYY